MNKAELVAAVAEKAGLSKKDSEKAINAAFEAITAALAAGEKVQLVGFGAFEVKERGARFRIGAHLFVSVGPEHDPGNLAHKTRHSSSFSPPFTVLPVLFSCF